jgi:Exocyst complex component Sec5
MSSGRYVAPAVPPRRTRSAGRVAGQARRRQRADRRALLDLYMQTASSEAAPATNDDVMDIDGGCFDPDGYLQMLMEREGMEELVRHNRQLQREVHKFDGQMKKLVYDNYQNFVAATDTTHKMKERVADMDEEMARLRAGMQSIEGLSHAVEDTLAQHRETVEHLSDVSRLLDSRQFLFELPERLTVAVDLGAYAQAVQYYHRTAGILRKYSHLNSFQQILDSCEDTVEKLRDRLRSIVASESTPSSEITENIRLLLDLNESPARLRDEFLQRRGCHIEHTLAEFEQQVTVLQQEATARQERGPAVADPPSHSFDEVDSSTQSSDDGESASQRGDVVTFISELNMSFLASLLEVIQCYRALFMSASRSTSSQRAASVDLEAFVEKLFSGFLSITRARLDCCSDASHLIRALEVLHRNLGNMAFQVGVACVLVLYVFVFLSFFFFFSNGPCWFELLVSV